MTTITNLHGAVTVNVGSSAAGVSATSSSSLAASSAAVHAVAAPAINLDTDAGVLELANEWRKRQSVLPIPSSASDQAQSVGIAVPGNPHDLSRASQAANPPGPQFDLVPVAKKAILCFMGRVGAQRAIKITHDDPATAKKNEADVETAYNTIVAHIKKQLGLQPGDDVSVRINPIRNTARVVVNGVEQETFHIDAAVPEVKAALDALYNVQLSMQLVTSGRSSQFEAAKSLGHEAGSPSFARSTERVQKLSNMSFETFESDYLDKVLDLQFPKPKEEALQAEQESKKQAAKTRIKDRLKKARQMQEGMKKALKEEADLLSKAPKPADPRAAQELAQQINLLEQLQKKLDADVFEACLALCFEAPQPKNGETPAEFQERRVKAGKEFQQAICQLLTNQNKAFYSFTGWGTGALETSEEDYAAQIAQMALANRGDKVALMGKRKMAQASFIEHAVVHPVTQVAGRMGVRYNSFEETRGFGRYLNGLPDDVQEGLEYDFVDLLNEIASVVFS